MSRRSPYDIVKSRYVTEKATVLENLKDAKSNQSVRRCESPKYVFLVDPTANKHEIEDAIKEIYPRVTVTAVNTIRVKPKLFNRRGNKGQGRSILIKKAVVTLLAGDSLQD